MKTLHMLLYFTRAMWRLQNGRWFVWRDAPTDVVREAAHLWRDADDSVDKDALACLHAAHLEYALRDKNGG